MKKILASILIISILSTLTVFARPGDVAGEYYSTDILTTLNGVEIDAINIGGETLISAEAMKDYGYSVIWNGEERTLDIYSLQNQQVTAQPSIEKPANPAGTVLGSYYETDIVTCIDGTPVTAFNIGGWTYIHAEKLREIGFDVIWDAEKWTLSVISPQKAGNIYSFPFDLDEVKAEEGIGTFSVFFQYDHDGREAVTTCTGDADYFFSIFSRNRNEYNFELSFHQMYGLFYSTKLKQKLDSLCYDGMGIENPCNPEEKYDEINKLLKISINGNVAQKIEVYKGGGNGHVDYIITVKDLPLYKKEEIKEVYISVGGEVGEPYKFTSYFDICW